MSVTQKQIAEQLGISRSLVGLALNGYSRVSEETRQRVEQAAQDLGYSANSNSVARSLRALGGGQRKRTHGLAVLIGELFEGTPVPDLPFFRPILQGMKAEAERREVDLSFFSTNVHRLPRALTEGTIDAGICIYTDRVSADPKEKARCPMVHLGGAGESHRALRPDDREGIYLVTRHLIELRHSRIAYLGDFNGRKSHNIAYKCRLDGYMQALREAGIAVHNELVDAHIGGAGAEDGSTGIARLLENNISFTAVVCFNDRSALGAIEELERRGLRVPEDVSVTGFDDVSEVPGWGSRLTTVFFDRFEMGRRAVEMVCAASEEMHSPEVHASLGHELLPVKLVVRESTGAPP